jgi:hypothetical protein
MYVQVAPSVYYGNWQAPVELVGKVGTVINVAHSFSRRRGRNAYWADLERVQWEVFYTRLARKDGQHCDEAYYRAFRQVVESARDLGKLPILTHCQMGGHRGPTAAIAALFILGYRTEAAFLYAKAAVLNRATGLAKGEGRPGGHNYHRSLLALCEADIQRDIL